MERLASTGYVRGIDEEKRTVDVVVSTGDIARDGMIIDPRGWQLENYDRNPVVLWAHNDRELPIARTLKTKRDGGDLIQTHEFAKHPRAQEVFELVRDGFVNATSVRWLSLETRVEKHDGKEVLVFKKQELLEVSYVPIPADANALVLRADGAVVNIADYLEREPEQPEPATAAVQEPSVAERFLRGFAQEAKA